MPTKEARSCASTIIVEIGENIGEHRGDRVVPREYARELAIVKYRPIGLCSFES